MAVNNEKGLSFDSFSTIALASEQLVSQGSSAKSVVCEISKQYREAKTNAVVQWAGKVAIFACQTL